MFKLNKTQSKMFNKQLNKSQQMRYLASINIPTKDIAKYLSTIYPNPIRYQFVRNVLNNPINKKEKFIK